MTDMSYKFNWHEEPERGFIQCVWLSLMQVGDRQDMMEITEGGRSITLRIFANDVEVNAREMMQSLEMNYLHAIQNRAAELAREIRFEELKQAVGDVEKAIQQELENRFKALGIEIKRDEYDY